MIRGGAILTATVAALTWNCSAPGTARSPVTLSIAVQGDVTGLYPAIRNESFTFAVNSALFEGLTRFGRNLQPEPAVADRWDSPDERTWVFHIRPGIRFSDGEPVRPADVVASLRYATGLVATQYLMAAVESVEEVSPDEVRVRTRFPFPVLLSHLTCAFILPKEALSRNPVSPVGTGPFKLESWKPGSELDLVENPFFHGARQGFERVRLRVVPDRGERVRALLAGDAEIIGNVPLDQIRDLRRHEGVRVVIRPTLKVLFLVLRTAEPHFKDPRVREAVELAIDREALVSHALGGFGTPARELVPPAVLGYDETSPSPPPDARKAKALLAAAGYPRGFDLRIEGPADHYTNSVEIMGEVARQLGEIGVRVTPDPMPKEAFFAGMDTPHFDLALYGWSCETVHAGELLDELVRTPQAAGGVNIAAFSDPALDRVIDAARQSPTLNERGHLLAQALRTVHATHAFVPLVAENESFAYTGAVDWDPGLDMALRIADLRVREESRTTSR
jgi:peptide/nickel transport system substrate-binding protein